MIVISVPERLSMIKVDIVNEVSRAAQVTKVKAELAVDAVFDAMRLSMQRGERIELRGSASSRSSLASAVSGAIPAPGRKSAPRQAAPSASSRARNSRISEDEEAPRPVPPHRADVHG